MAISKPDRRRYPLKMDNFLTMTDCCTDERYRNIPADLLDELGNVFALIPKAARGPINMLRYGPGLMKDMNACQKPLADWLAQFSESDRDEAAAHVISQAILAKSMDRKSILAIRKLFLGATEEKDKDMSRKVEKTILGHDIRIDCSLRAVGEGLRGALERTV
ncbi:hypothetical protein ElyMa_000447600 [Elysia marginata]|uniref:Uncharacterized protein n=1 Tax=Elysia marginata TaxID=1093978 RepID=A0AAV4FQW6_9GAST|nr:hypothetical protein ElyMa_000447600 [Elysia marginata]